MRASSTVATVLRALALASAILVAAEAFLLALMRPPAMDFVPLYAAGRLVALGRPAAILDTDAIRGIETAVGLPDAIALFVHPPAVALLLAPLGALPFSAAYAVMATVDALLVVAAVVLLRPLSAPRLALGLLLIAPPAAVAVAQGQTSPLVLLLVALAIRLPAPAGGVALGLTALRPQTAPLLLLAGLVRRDTRPWTIAGALGVAAVSVGVVGLDGSLRYLSLLVSAGDWSRTGAYGLTASVGWSGIALWLGSGPLGLALTAASGVAGAIVIVRERGGDARRLGSAAVWSLLASPHALVHDALLAYPLLLRIVRRDRPWDAIGALTWAVHLGVAPIAALWSVVLVVVGSREKAAVDGSVRAAGGPTPPAHPLADRRRSGRGPLAP